MAKTFPFVVGGVEYHLQQLPEDIKVDVADRITVDRLRAADRRFKKKLTTSAEYLAEKEVASVKWGGEPISHELRQNEQAQRILVRALLVEAVDEATLTRLMQAEELQDALQRVQEDDRPKDQTAAPTTTPPVSASTPTAGAPSS